MPKAKSKTKKAPAKKEEKVDVMVEDPLPETEKVESETEDVVVEDPVPEPEEVVKSPEEIKKEELTAKRDKLKGEIENITLDANKSKLGKITCLNCGEPLTVDMGGHLRQQLTTRRYICPNCEYVNEVKTTYETDSKQSDVVIEQYTRGFAFQTNAPSELSENQRKAYIAHEVSQIKARKSRLPAPLQILFLEFAEK